ncbi:hypothetical protein QOT17_009552 [Balamuthia mandrillaris]
MEGGGRVLSVDVLRAFLVHGVVIGHILRFFEVNSFGLELFTEESPTLNTLLLCGHMWVVPSLFFLSGYSLFHSLKKSLFTSSSPASVVRIYPDAIAFLLRRVKSHLAVVFVALFLFVVPKQFLSETECAGVVAPSNLFAFYPFYFVHCFASKGFEWLWFIIVLLGLTAFHLPFFLAIHTSSPATTTLTGTRPRPKGRQHQHHQNIEGPSLSTTALLVYAWIPLACLAAWPLAPFLLFGTGLFYMTLLACTLLSCGRTSRKQFRQFSSLLPFILFFALFVSYATIVLEDSNNLTRHPFFSFLFVILLFGFFFVMGFCFANFERDHLASSSYSSSASSSPAFMIVIALLWFAVYPLFLPFFDDVTAPTYILLNGFYATYFDNGTTLSSSFTSSASSTFLRFRFEVGKVYCVISLFLLSRLCCPSSSSKERAEAEKNKGWLRRTSFFAYLIHPLLEFMLARLLFLFGQHHPQQMWLNLMAMVSGTYALLYVSSLFFSRVPVLNRMFLLCSSSSTSSSSSASPSIKIN